MHCLQKECKHGKTRGSLKSSLHSAQSVAIREIKRIWKTRKQSQLAMAIKYNS